MRVKNNRPDNHVGRMGFEESKIKLLKLARFIQKNDIWKQIQNSPSEDMSYIGFNDLLQHKSNMLLINYKIVFSHRKVLLWAYFII